jgi:hypothetical protein
MNYEEYTAHDGPWEQIGGWLDHGVFMALHLFNETHKQHGIVGNIGEIGVHEGQLFCALALLSDPIRERLLAIDVFDDQELNVDNSGGSSYEEFQRNLSLIGKKRINAVRIIEGDSLNVTPRGIFAKILSPESDALGLIVHPAPSLEGTSCFRLFSIDGGHTVVHALNDLRLVEQVMVPGGIVIVDDFMHPKWPGVTEALHIYCSDRASRLAPIAYGNNKMYLTTAFSRDLYRDWIEANPHNNVGFFGAKQVELYGRKVGWAHFDN